MFELTEQHRIDRALRTKLRELCASARSDAALFAVLTVVLTPLAVAVLILLLLFAFAFVDLPVVDHLGYRLSFVTGANLCLAFMAASYFLRPKEQYQRGRRHNLAAGGLRPVLRHPRPVLCNSACPGPSGMVLATLPVAGPGHAGAYRPCLRAQG